ncbi:MAG: adenine deaminase [Parachlamydiaceae bacterium]|nr:adenine deaminase [Parachlamydiaceae bacterium]
MTHFSRSGIIIDLIKRRIFPGTVYIDNGKISNIAEDIQPKSSVYILPGFVDAHVHVESSMLIPSEFARLASVHGTVATVSDPHEIGNVLGLEGIRYMLSNGEKVPFHFYFGASSCVPATAFETAGAEISPSQIEELFVKDGLRYLSEMMNFPGVLHRNPIVMEKIRIAHSLNKPVDGHAPGLRGEEAKAYIDAGIGTDHECFTLEEALDKVKYGMKILIREGSAAKNYEALHPLIKMFPEQVMFCSDDKHPHELAKGHINEIVRRAVVEDGHEIIDVLRAACVNPVKHYGLDVGLLQVGDSADFIVIDNLQNFGVLETYVQGELVATHGKTLIASVEATTPNHFNVHPKELREFFVAAEGLNIRVIEAEEGQLITKELVLAAKIEQGGYVSDVDRDILKIAVVNRYRDAPVAVAFVKNFGLKRGAIASCVAHDSHNIIAVGCSDEEICAAVNALIEQKGGIAVVDGKEKHVLALPVAGIMSHLDGYEIAEKYADLDAKAKQLGSKLYAPFMTLSFMALLVIPELKLSDKGLFRGQEFVDLSV